jgi:hypothetical protein
MPSVSVRLSKAQTDDLATICGLGVARLNQLADALDQTKPSIDRRELRRVIAGVAGESQAVDAAWRALPALAIAFRRFNVTASDLLDSVRKSLVNQGWKEEDLRSWHECRPVIEKILMSPAVVLPAKARELAFDFERIYTRARILTDVRPIFDDPRNEIIGANITQTLRLDYTSRNDSSTSLSLALDMSDIAELKKCCEDALRKADISREMIQTKWGIEAALPGEGTK